MKTGCKTPPTMPERGEDGRVGVVGMGERPFVYVDRFDAALDAAEYHQRDAAHWRARAIKYEHMVDDIFQTVGNDGRAKTEARLFLARAEKAEARVKELEQRLASDEGETDEDRQAIAVRNEEIRKLTDAVLRKGLGDDGWNKFWGPHLEMLGDVVAPIVERAEEERASHERLIDVVSRGSRALGIGVPAIGVAVELSPEERVRAMAAAVREARGVARQLRSLIDEEYWADNTPEEAAHAFAAIAGWPKEE